MAENEELKLTVTLVDNASAGLRQLQTQMQEMGGGSGAQNAQRAARNFQELHERGLKPLFDTIDKAGRVIFPEFSRGLGGSITGLVAFGAGAGTAALAITKMLDSIADAKGKFNEWIQTTIRLKEIQILTGQHAADIKQVSEAYERAGQSAAHGEEDFIAASHALGDLSRSLSQTRQEALKGVLTPEQRGALVQGIGALAAKDDVAGAMRLLKEYASFAKQNAVTAAKERGDSEVQIAQRGADAEAQVMQILGQKYLRYVSEPIYAANRKQREIMEENQKLVEDYEMRSQLIAQHWTHIADASWRAFAGWGPIKAIMDSAEKVLAWLDPERGEKAGPPTYDEYLKEFRRQHPPLPARYGPQPQPVPRPTGVPEPPELHPALPRGSPATPGGVGGAGRPRVIQPMHLLDTGAGDGMSEMEKRILATGGRYSTNIEDNRKVEVADNLQKATRDLADEMKRLNDYLLGVTAPGGGALGLVGAGGGSMRMGGLAPGLGAGPMGGLPGFGQAPYGSDAGPGGGEGAGETPAGGGGAGVRGVRMPFGGGVRMPGARRAPHGSDVGPGTGEGAGETPAYSGAGGSKFLAEQRAPFAKELAEHPELKRHLAALLTRENEGEAQAVTESLFNRTAYVNQARAKKGLAPLSLSQMIDIGGRRSFYGPERRGEVPGAEAALRHQPAREARLEAAIDAAISSNLLKGATDQGSGVDPNVNWPGGRIKLHARGGETYTDWGGGPGGHEGARKFREAQQAAIAHGGMIDDYQIASSAVRRSMIDRQMTHRVEGTGSIDVNVNAPKGTGVRARGGGIFRTVSVNRTTQMERAATSSNVEE